MTNLANHTAEDIAPLEALFPDRLNPSVREMAIECYLFLLEDFGLVEKLGKSKLAELVIGQIGRISNRLGGSQFYLARDIKWVLSDRDCAIAAEFNGRNVIELRQKYKLSDTRIRQIVTAVHKRKLAAK